MTKETIKSYLPSDYPFPEELSALLFEQFEKELRECFEEARKTDYSDEGTGSWKFETFDDYNKFNQ